MTTSPEILNDPYARQFLQLLKRWRAYLITQGHTEQSINLLLYNRTLSLLISEYLQYVKEGMELQATAVASKAFEETLTIAAKALINYRITQAKKKDLKS